MYKVTIFYGIPSAGITDNLDIYTDKSLGYIEDYLPEIVMARVSEKDGLKISINSISWNNITKVEKLDGVIK